MGKKKKIFFYERNFERAACYFSKSIYVKLEMLINEHKW